MEKVRPWCGQPSDRGRLKEQEQNRLEFARSGDIGKRETAVQTVRS